MTQRTSFIRKVVYLAIMVGLLFGLSYISDPATVRSGSAKGSAGGMLAQLRAKHGLTQANLGEIDPTSETIKLATLGMRGVASNILWEKARDYQKKQDWTNLSATLEQIIRLQPNFVSVWKFQGWNYSYNVSAEFDDYKDRYFWVKKGINFLQEGTRYNENEPRLISDIGRFISQKIGRADEHRQFRRLFRDDTDFHGKQYPESDNWLVGKEWHLKSVAAVETGGATIRGTSPLLFYSEAPMCQYNYAVALEQDGGADGRGVFGDRAQQAWNGALTEWKRYGQRDIPTTTGLEIKLGALAAHKARLEKLAEELESIQPGLKEKLQAEKRAKLSKEQKAALKVPAADRTPEQVTLAMQAEYQIRVTPQEIAAAIEGRETDRVKKLADAVAKETEMVDSIDRYHGIVNYPYWQTRAEVERDPETIAARKLLADGDYAYNVIADPVQAATAYEAGMAKWKDVIADHPEIMDDDTILADLVASIERYEVILGQEERKLPENFILQEVLDKYHSIPR